MKNLPRNITPEYSVTLPLSGKKLKIRPFLVKEERVLLTAMEAFNAGEKDAISEAVLQIVENCILTKGVNAKELPILDIESIFLELRKRSVGDVIELVMAHKNGCGHENRIKVNLNNVEVHRDEKHSNVIQLTDKYGVSMKYPTFETSLEGLTEKDDSVRKLYDLIATSIDTIYDGDEVSSAKDYTKEQLVEWLDTFTSDQMRKIVEFFNTMPYFFCKVKYKCEKCGEDDEIEVKGTASFFT